MDPGNRLKRWMIGVGCAGLLAGIPIGVALHQAYEKPPIRSSPLVDRFERRYRLSRKQKEQIQRVLEVRDRDILEVYGRLGGVPAWLQGDIMNIRRRADERIQAVLDSAQREQYRKDSPQESAGRK